VLIVFPDFPSRSKYLKFKVLNSRLLGIFFNLKGVFLFTAVGDTRFDLHPPDQTPLWQVGNTSGKKFTYSIILILVLIFLSDVFLAH
jgi:hypothetical protein